MPFHQLIHNHLLNFHPFHRLAVRPLPAFQILQLGKPQPGFLELCRRSPGLLLFHEHDLEFPFMEVVSDDDLVAVARQCLLRFRNQKGLFRLELREGIVRMRRGRGRGPDVP
jgi:hypothetical protein